MVLLRAALLLLLATAVSAQSQRVDSVRSDSSVVDDSVRVDENITLAGFLRESSTMDSLFLFRVFAHDDLMKMYHGDVADLLWNVAGMTVHDLGSFGKPISASFNGLSNQHVLVLLDDQPLNDPDLEWMNLNSISLENIERIEVYKGSQAGRFGSSASGGVIRVVSRTIPQGRAITSIKFRSVFSSFEDVGAFFGRTLGSRTEIRAGGSSKSTPGEQNIQGFRGGFVRNIQRTRYSGNVIFIGAKYLALDNLLADFYMQRSRDQYDAYGRNRFGDSKNLDFTTPNGERKDQRREYRLQITHRTSWFDHSATGSIIEIDREAKQFDDTSLAPLWKNRQIRLHYEMSRVWRANRLTAGVTWTRLESKKTIGTWTWSEWFVQDEVVLKKWNVSGALHLTTHSQFDPTIDGNLTLARLWGRHRAWINGGWSNQIPSSIDQWISQTPNPFGTGPSSLQIPNIASLSAGIEWNDVFAFNRISVSGYIHKMNHSLYYYPVNFDSDSTTVQLMNGGRDDVKGVDLEARYRTGFIVWSARQSIMQAPREVHAGVATFTTFLTGEGELRFLKDNLKLTGWLQARSVSRHGGLSYQDLPPIYFISPRRSSGGWMVNTRITATIGDFHIFYEAENILRARFTLLDGYDVTPQQVRVGLIWKLYN